MGKSRTGRIVITLAMVLLLVLAAACTPAPQETTPTPTPASASEKVAPTTKEVTPLSSLEPTPTVERGIIALARYWYWPNTKQLVEVDIVFDKDDAWGTGEGSFYDIQNIATHELGHTLVLGDLRSPNDGALTMHAYSWWEDIDKRTLGSGDKLGIQAIYGD